MKNEQELNPGDFVLILDNAVGWKGLARIIFNKRDRWGYDLQYMNAPEGTPYAGPYSSDRLRKLTKLEVALYKMKCNKNE